MRTNLLLCAAILLTTGCTSAAGTSVTSPRPSATLSAGPSRAPTAPLATPSVQAASTLTCRLPVISPTTDRDPVPGGWITFPGGQFVRDPASLPNRLQEHVPSYDRAVSRWLPVEYRYVAPDGRNYILHGTQALPDPSAFYLVDVKSGSQKLALAAGPSEAPGSWDLIDYSSAGVYLWSTGMASVPGLWLLDPRAGTVRLINGSQYWSMVSGAYAWALAVPNQPANAPSQDTVYRLDLATGQVNRWYQSGASLRFLTPTSDGEMLLLISDGDSANLGLLTGPGQLQFLSVPAGMPFVTDAYLRHPGIWLSLRGGGLALYTKADGVRVMTRSPDIFDVAGGCWN